ncbi:MAG: hypothetical protein K5683_02000 [Prevotella sp.]|nr:hypothetical protein [Prevotella sp.]
MKKGMFIILLSAGILLSSCGSYEATGAYTGSQFGHMIGSAIGGIAGGWRGHEIGSIIGTVGGAAAGAAIGHAADKAQQQKYEERATARQRRIESQRSRDYGTYNQGNESYNQGSYDQSGFDPQMRGDDRITFDNGNGNTDNNRASFNVTGASGIIIRNAGIYEDQRDGVLTRGETCKVMFEILNNSNQAIYDIFPLVEEATGNKHVHISPNLRIESIAPHQAIRYTASLTADKGLRNGQIQVRVGVAQGNNVVMSQTRQFTVRTAKHTAGAR